MSVANDFGIEHGSVAEELLKGVSAFELKRAAVEASLEDGYLSLNEALKAYKLTKKEYLLLSVLDLLKKDNSQSQSFNELVEVIYKTYATSASELDTKGKKILNTIAKSYKHELAED
jgi:hypothetical protein